MKKIVNQITLTKENQGDDFAKVLGETILTLLREEEMVSIRDDDTNILILEHEHDNYKEYWGTPTCMWLEDDEVELIEDYRADKENEEDKEDGDNYEVEDPDDIVWKDGEDDIVDEEVKE